MYLFFVRHFNDVDHIVPVIWEMAMNEYPVAVYCLNPEYDINGDYRLNFLRKLGIDVDYVYNDVHHNLGIIHRILSFLFRLFFEIKRNSDNDRGTNFTRDIEPATLAAYVQCPSVPVDVIKFKKCYLART